MNLPTSDLLAATALAMLGLGLYGLLATRNLIKLLIALQLIGKGAVLAMVLAGRVSGQPALGQALAVSVIVADTAVAVLGVAIAVRLHQRTGSLDVGALTRLKG